MNITEEQAKKARELVEWMRTRTECTREEAAASVGMTDGRDFRLHVWWPSVQVLWEQGVAYRSLGGGGRYAVTGWSGKWKTANKTLKAARSRFSRAAMRLPGDAEVPEDKRAALARSRDKMGHSDMVLMTKEHAHQVLVATTDYAGMLGCETSARATK